MERYDIQGAIYPACGGILIIKQCVEKNKDADYRKMIMQGSITLTFFPIRSRQAELHTDEKVSTS